MNRDVVFILLLGGVYVGIMLAWRKYRTRQLRQLWEAGHEALTGGNAEAAVAAFRKCSRILPAMPGFHEALGTALGQAGRLEEAERELKMSVDLEPSRARSHMNLALFYAFAKPGMEREAKESFERARALDPGMADEALGRAHIAARMEEIARLCGAPSPDAKG